MLARPERGERDGRMQMVGQRDRDDVDVGAPQDLAVILIEIGDGKMVGDLPAADGADLPQGDHARGRMLLKALNMVPADGAGADHGHAVNVFFSWGG